MINHVLHTGFGLLKWKPDPQPHRRGRGEHHDDVTRYTAMTETNAIAILCMLGTKGSVSNLVSVSFQKNR